MSERGERSGLLRSIGISSREGECLHRGALFGSDGVNPTTKTLHGKCTGCGKPVAVPLPDEVISEYFPGV